MSETEAAPSSSVRPDSPPANWYRRVLLKLSGEVFGGGRIGVDPDVAHSLALQIAEVVAGGTQVAIVVGGGNFFRGAELQPARHGPRPRRLHGHARHRHELPGPAGLPREGRRADPRADRDHDGSGRRALHPAAGRAAPGEGPRRDLRRRRRPALLLHRHRGRAAGARDRLRGAAARQERGRRRVRRRSAPAPRGAAGSTRSPTTRSSSAACRWPTPPHSASAGTTACRSSCSGSTDGNIARVVRGEKIGTLVTGTEGQLT